MFEMGSLLCKVTWRVKFDEGESSRRIHILFLASVTKNIYIQRAACGEDSLSCFDLTPIE